VDYENERRAVGRINIGQSLRNLELLGLVREAVDLPATPGPGSKPEALAKAIAELSDDGPTGDARRARVHKAISAQYEQLDALSIDLGFRYPVTGEQAVDLTAPGNNVRDYLPSTEPGVRLPHAWLELNGQTVSTLDLIGRGVFTVILGEDSEGWEKLLSKIPEKVPVRTVHIGSTCEAFDIEGQWELLRGVEAGGAILVRPDGHVAWRGDVVSVELIQAIFRSIGWPESSPSTVGELA
jgi:2,4-dichlorophenol 6-monooxygenase